MTDQFDRASDLEQKDRDIMIAAIRRRCEALPYAGTCYYCGEFTKAGRRFCDSDCRDDFERQEAIRSKQGRR